MSTFSSTSYPYRLFCGVDVLEKHLPNEMKRHDAQRVFVLCSPSIASRTTLVQRIRSTLGPAYAGAFSELSKDSTFASVQDAARCAAEVRADMLVAVGGGSVIVSARAVAIFLAEADDPFQLMTQYAAGVAARSPRLMAKKLPIINVPTTPTTAMNRAGTALKNTALNRRMEFFDPKTRPQAIFWDVDGLMATPVPILRSAAVTVFARSLAEFSVTGANPLAEGDRIQSFQLAQSAIRRLAEGDDSLEQRINLISAALLQTRAEDGEPRSRRSSTFTGNYAVSTALHVRHDHIGQGEATSVLAATVMRQSPVPDRHVAERVARGLGPWQDGMSPRAATLAVADEIEQIFSTLHMPIALRQTGIRREDLSAIAAETVHNFNANSAAVDIQAEREASLRLLEAAW